MLSKLSIRVADEDAIVLLARTWRARRELSDLVIAALEEVETSRASAAAAALKAFVSQTDDIPSQEAPTSLSGRASRNKGNAWKRKRLNDSRISERGEHS